MTDPRPLAERVREIAEWYDHQAKGFDHAGLDDDADHYRRDAKILHQAADELEARKDQP